MASPMAKLSADTLPSRGCFVDGSRRGHVYIDHQRDRGHRISTESLTELDVRAL